jgi:hypothetical protein
MNIRLIVYKILLIIEKTEKPSKIEMIESIVWELISFLINDCRSFSIDHCINLRVKIDFEMKMNCRNFLMKMKKMIVSENFLLLMTRETIYLMIVKVIFLTEIIFSLIKVIVVSLIVLVMILEILMIFFVIRIVMTMLVRNNLLNFDQNSFLVNDE